ncbi:hypothetical protein [Marinobacterium aestuariivivens]|uniref:Uncharacterized protein n=1 Tax=Marinobacterium aestuariivivens TaxID=1698799 RepID=A0ABW2A538_9GAMM
MKKAWEQNPTQVEAWLKE